MILTEDDAKTKWCPHARISEEAKQAHLASPSFNRTETQHDNSTHPDDPLYLYFGAIPSQALCLGSGCMNWEWNISPEAAAARGGDIKPNGYCGLGTVR